MLWTKTALSIGKVNHFMSVDWDLRILAIDTYSAIFKLTRDQSIAGGEENRTDRRNP